MKFLLVGAQALAVHGRPRFTGDLDVWIERNEDNAKRIVEALAAFGFSGFDYTPFTEFDRVATLGKEPVRVDIFTHIPGPTFEEAWERRTHVTVDGKVVPVIGREDFIVAKRASGRPKDLLDLELLQEIAKE